MRKHSLVLAAALPAFSEGKPVIQVPVPTDLINNSANVFDHDTPRQTNNSLPTLQPHWDDEVSSAAREATDWHYYVNQGSVLMAQMQHSDQDAAQLFPVPKTSAQSPYGLGTLTQWGYMINENVPKEYRDFGPGPQKWWGISSFLQRHKISDKCREEGGLWNAAMIAHKDLDNPIAISPLRQKYKGPDGKTRPLTGAYFYIAVNPEGGIMTQNLLTPWEALKLELPHPNPANLPAMQKSSDMMWALWELYIMKGLYSNLAFFIAVAINNPTTLSLIQRALHTQGKSLTPEGVKISTKTEAGKALLSSPNGAGFAYLLIQRKAQVGLKYIDHVWVMQCEDQSTSTCMTFVAHDLKRPKKLLTGWWKLLLGTSNIV